MRRDPATQPLVRGSSLFSKCRDHVGEHWKLYLAMGIGFELLTFATFFIIDPVFKDNPTAQFIGNILLGTFAALGIISLSAAVICADPVSSFRRCC